MAWLETVIHNKSQKVICIKTNTPKILVLQFYNHTEMTRVKKILADGDDKSLMPIIYDCWIDIIFVDKGTKKQDKSVGNNFKGPWSYLVFTREIGYLTDSKKVVINSITCPIE